MKLSPTLPILIMLAIVQIAAIFLSVPIKSENLQTFGDPQSIQAPIMYLGLVIVVTAIMLILLKYRLGGFLKAFFMFTVWASVYFVLSTIILQTVGDGNAILDLSAFALAVIGALLMWKYPEWYVVDTVGVIMCAGATAILGTSFGIWPVIVFLTIFAIYDYIAVYRTRHMISLAEGVLNEKLPALFIVPKQRGFSNLGAASWNNLDNTGARQASIIGMGDIVVPSVLVVSSNVFLATSSRLLGVFTLPAIGAMVGSWVGLVVLEWFADRYPQSHAGLPILNTATILGFAIAFGITILIGA